MADQDKQLRVKRSNLPDAGKGLFTKVFIPKGTRIVEYLGTITNWKDVQHQEGKNGYIFYVKRNHVIDAGPHPDAIARYANDARDSPGRKGLSIMRNTLKKDHVCLSLQKRIFLPVPKSL